METDFAPAGGCFPVRVKGQGLVGTVTVSGIPQRDDHRLASESIAEYLGIDLGEFNL
ncbi:MAG: heme-binding protein [Micrococcales bacterium]